MTNASRLAYVACALSAAALAVSTFALLRTPPRDGVATAGSALPDPDREIEGLRGRIDALEANARQWPRQVVVSGNRVEDLGTDKESGAAGSDAGNAPAPSEPRDQRDAFRPRYQALRSTNPAVTLTQDHERRFLVENSDPALAGSIVYVEAIREDGQQDSYQVVVPAPGDSPALR